MTRRYFRLVYLLAIITAIGTGFDVPPVLAAADNPTDAGKDIQVLAHGPIHEAFAETITFDPQAGTRVPNPPPPVIEEIPPDEKPEGDAQWIPGYWAWDDDKSDFIWVSGIWRVPPPNRQWIPGYWKQVDQGFQWISGYWVNVKATETEYLPEPPESVEVGPNVNAPSPDHAWIPGCWIWHTGRYVWRPGYWARMQSDWIWVPAHYSWTPRGYVFVGGYWDYPVVRRGVIFAPVFIPPALYSRVTFSFSPGFVIDLNVFSDCLFIRPGYHHYYFGDYYAPRYYRGGIYPWFSLHAQRRTYDPIFAHQRWTHRHDHEWERRIERTFQERRQNKEMRPSRWATPSVRQGKSGIPAAGKGRAVAVPFNHETRNKDAAFRYKRLNENEKKEFHKRENEVRTYRKDRSQRESQELNKPTERSSRASGQNKSAFPKSPITAKPADQLDKKSAPPSRYRVPKSNPEVEPLQRRSGTQTSWNRNMKPESSGRTSGGGDRGERQGKSGNTRTDARKGQSSGGR